MDPSDASKWPGRGPLPIILIGAMTKNRVIGKGDQMPWDIPEEYQTFVDSIRGQTVIIGRKSYEQFGPDLTSDHTIVVSRSDLDIDPPVAHGMGSALQQAKQYGKTIFVAGGAQIYELALPLADWMFLSEIKGEYAGDRYFPQWDLREWEVAHQEDHERFIYRQWRRVA